MSLTKDLTVFIATHGSSCTDCGEDLDCGAWITKSEKQRSRCLSCSDIDHLVFLASGNAALTLRARKLSTLSAIVVKWSKARKRYERQGVLVEEAGLMAAESACLNDEEARAQRREREAKRRATLDRAYVDGFALRVRELFPGCPAGVERVIAEHACQLHSGRIGRSAAAKVFDEQAVNLAVIAHVRHAETSYDRLLASGGYDRQDARHQVKSQIDAILGAWGRA